MSREKKITENRTGGQTMKLNRAEIIKACEVCFDDTTDSCRGCPYLNNCKHGSLRGLALALIKELTEENKELRNQVQMLDAEAAYKNGYAMGFADAKADWISVNDRMPEDMYGKHRKKITVLVCTESGRVSTASRQRAFCFDQTKKKWLELDTFEWNNRKRVTHWMPLPEPPKGE